MGVMSVTAASIESVRRNCPHGEDRIKWCTLWPWPDHLTTCMRNIFCDCCPAELGDRWEWRACGGYLSRAFPVLPEWADENDVRISVRANITPTGWSPLPPWLERLRAGESP